MLSFLLCLFSGLFAVSAIPPLFPRDLQRWRRSSTPLPTSTVGTSPYTTPSALTTSSPLSSPSSSPSLTPSSRVSKSSFQSPSSSRSPLPSKSDSSSPTSPRSPSSYITVSPYPSSSISPSTRFSSTTSSSASITPTNTPTPTPTPTDPCYSWAKAMGALPQYCKQFPRESDQNAGALGILWTITFACFFIMFLLATCFFSWRFNGICFLEEYGRYTCGGPELWVSPCFCVPCLFPVFLSSLCCLYSRLKKREQIIQAAAQQAAAQQAASRAASRAAQEKALAEATGRDKRAKEREENPDTCSICLSPLDQDPSSLLYYNFNNTICWTICIQCKHVSHPVCQKMWEKAEARIEREGKCSSCNIGTLRTVPIPLDPTRKVLEQRHPLASPSHVGGSGAASSPLPSSFTIAVRDDLPPSRPASPHSF